MGLTMIAYSGLSLIEEFTGEIGSELWFDFKSRNENYITLWDNKVFPGRINPFVTGAYSFEDEIDFDIGYGSYYFWRDKLCIMLVNDKLESVCDTDNYDKYKNMKFFELVHFSDCEGTIGTKTLKKLKKDFDCLEKLRINSSEGKYIKEDIDFWDKFKNIKELVAFSHTDGAIKFS